METSIDHSGAVLAFGPFRWNREQRALFKGETLLSLGSRARGILSILVERAGQLVKRSELIARVWGGGIVEEGTLRTHIALLRRALACEQIDGGYIETVNGLGYRFIGNVERLAEPAVSSASMLQTSAAVPCTRVIGRDDVIATLAQRIREKRFLTLVGPGGIGKTTVANTAMTQLREHYADGVYFVDFSAVSDERLIATTLADALDIPSDTSVPVHELIGSIANRQLLIVLDNCEHVIGAVAPLAELLLLQTTDIHILATSREPLRIQGEWVLRLPPLAVPPRTRSNNARDVLEYSAVRLFVQLATANNHAFELTDSDAPLAAEICRQLDGLPLAIELAAAQAALFGIRGLSARPNELLDLLTQGRRTAPPRHRTLRATLQWSFNLLSQTERQALRRLSGIEDSFNLKDARAAVAGDGVEGIDGIDVLDVLSSLTAKSMIVADSHEDGHFRLLQTTRSFALAEVR